MTVAVEPPPVEIAERVDQLIQAGAHVLYGRRLPGFEAGILGFVEQLVPDGPLIVHVNALAPLWLQTSMLNQAFEWLFDPPADKRWAYKTVDTADRGQLTLRRITVRVEPAGDHIVRLV